MQKALNVGTHVNLFVLTLLVTVFTTLDNRPKFQFHIKEGIIKNISYERRAFESVDDKSRPILGYISKHYEKRNSWLKELTLFLLALPYFSV